MDSQDLFEISNRERYDFMRLHRKPPNEILGEFSRRRRRRRRRKRQSGVIYALSNEGLYVLPLFICSVYYLEP